MTIVRIFNLAILGIIVGVSIQSEEKCDVLYDAVTGIRDNFYKNGIAVALIQRKYMDSWLKSLEDYFKISADDDTEIRRKACQAAEATSVAELAAVFGKTNKHMSKYLSRAKSRNESYSYWIPRSEKRMKIVHRFIKKIKFPEVWPVQTNMGELRRFLNKASWYGRAAFLYWGRDYHKLSLKLTRAKSLDHYLELMDLDPDDEEVQGDLEYPKLVKDKKLLLKLFSGGKSIVSYYRAVAEYFVF